MPTPAVTQSLLALVGALLLVSCDQAEHTSSSADVPGDAAAAPAATPATQSAKPPVQSSTTEGFVIRVTGPYFDGTQSYRLSADQLSGNFFDSATYLKSKSVGSGVGDFLAEGDDGSGLYRVSVTIQGGSSGTYPFGNGTEVSLYLQNNGDVDPRCGNTAGPCTGVALAMIDGSIDIEELSSGDAGRVVKINFAGTFERTDTPGDGRDTYQVEGEADLVL